VLPAAKRMTGDDVAVLLRASYTEKKGTEIKGEKRNGLILLDATDKALALDAAQSAGLTADSQTAQLHIGSSHAVMSFPFKDGAGEVAGLLVFTRNIQATRDAVQTVIIRNLAWMALILALGFMGNMVQSNSIGDAFHNAFGLNRLAVGVVVAAIAAFIFLGGVQRIAAVTEKVVPIMAAFYILGCIVILVINAKALPGALAQVFVLAFEPQAMAGGIAGVTVQQSMRFGVARGLFSNEAGLGSTPHAHALAKVERPQDQGAVAILGVFVDTFVVLTLTGLVLITSGLIPQGMTGTALTQAAFSQSFGGFGPIFIAVCMFFFAFSTIIGWYFFGQSNFKALFGEKLLPVYSIIVVAFILVGSTLKVDLVWALADLFNGLMAVPNLLALLALAGVVVAIDRK
jgi:AGCS family alanine or glycine:cation symporter